MSLPDVIETGSQRPPRVVVLGAEKVGKSTFASEFPDVIFLPIKGEEGIDDVGGQRFPTVKSYSELMERLGQLYSEDHDRKFVAIDSVSTLEPLVWDHTCKVLGVTSIEAPGYGKGYTEALKYWREILDGLDALREEKGMGCVLIGHVKVKLFNDPMVDPYDTYLFDINEKAANALFRWSDSILFIGRKVITKTTEGGFNKRTTHAIATKDEPVLYTRKKPAHPGGGRGAFGRLAPELPLSYAAYEEAILNVSNGKV